MSAVQLLESVSRTARVTLGMHPSTMWRETLGQNRCRFSTIFPLKHAQFDRAGTVVGAEVGASEGSGVGASTGTSVGGAETVGALDIVGSSVGVSVGAAVGTAVGRLSHVTWLAEREKNKNGTKKTDKPIFDQRDAAREMEGKLNRFTTFFCE